MTKFNFPIANKGIASKAFMALGLTFFDEVTAYIARLPYARNSNKSELLVVLKENCGTCSTKHTLLKSLADEQGYDLIKLIVGIFKMNPTNTPQVAQTLAQYRLDYLPEAHCYLKHQGQIYDFTKSKPLRIDFDNDLLEEIEIEPQQVGQYKIDFHRTFLENWLKNNPQISFSKDALWLIREQCIKDLS
jgi:DICT domain-containing protein